MPSFPSRDFTNQYISRSYQDVVQQYIDGGPTDYLLDGYGNIIFSFDSASYGAKLITTEETNSIVVISSSYAKSASWSDSSLSASYAPGNPSISASYALSASYSETSSFASIAVTALSASYALASTSASYAQRTTSASYSETASVSITASYSITSSFATFSNMTTSASFADRAISASYSDRSISASFADRSISASYADISISASYADRSISSSYAETASFIANNIFGNNTLTGSTLKITKLAQGLNTVALGANTFAGGSNTNAVGNDSFVHGRTNTTIARGSHAEGSNTTTNGAGSHTEGLATVTNTDYSHAEGSTTQTNGVYSHAEGFATVTLGEASHAEGSTTSSTGSYSHAEGSDTVTLGNYSHAEGTSSISFGTSSHAEGFSTITSGSNSHAEGNSTITQGDDSHAEGFNTIATGTASHAEGRENVTNGNYSHAEGFLTTTNNFYAHAEGRGTSANGIGSHAEGKGGTSIGVSSHAEGLNTTSQTDFSHAEGDSAISFGTSSHAEGFSTISSGSYSHAQGISTIAQGIGQAVMGQYNTPDSTSLVIIGNGTDIVNTSNVALFSSQSIVFSQSVTCSSVITAPQFTGSLFGTASNANNSISSDTASYIRNNIFGNTDLTGSNLKLDRIDTPLISLFSASIGNDTFIFRSTGSGIVGIRNGTNPCGLEIYNTFVNPASSSRGLASWESNIFVVGTKATGSSVPGRETRITGSLLAYGTSGSVRWIMTPAGHLIASASNALDIGSTGSNKPRIIYAGTSVMSSGDVQAATDLVAGAAGKIMWATSTRMTAPSDGVVVFTDSALTSFSRLCFGGATSGDMSLKKSSVGLQARNGDDSAFTTFEAGTLICSGSVTTGPLTMLSGSVLQINSGTKQRAGNATLVGGTVTVSNVGVTANTVIMLTRKTIGGTVGNLSYTVSAGTSFTINSSSGTDTSVVSYFLLEVV